MNLRVLAGVAPRDDHRMLEMALSRCANGSTGVCSMHIGVMNEFGSIYLDVETSDDREFVDAVQCLASLGFCETRVFDVAQSRFHVIVAMS